MTTTTQPQAAQRTTWAIDAKHSLVELAVKHMMFTTVKGRFARVEGTIVADEADPARSTVAVQIDAASIDTREEQRDGHLRAPEFLHVDEFPQVTFKSTRVEPVAGDRLRVIGDLTIRGVTREVALDTTYHGRGANPFGQEVAGFTAETTLNRRDFGLTWNVALETGGVLVSDQVKVFLEIQAVRTEG